MHLHASIFLQDLVKCWIDDKTLIQVNQWGVICVIGSKGKIIQSFPK